MSGAGENRLTKLGNKISIAVVLVYAVGLFSWAAFATGGLFERDGYFHARFAETMPERGISRQFPWTQLSTWRDRFCDKEFLYHLAMMPFAQVGDEPLRGVQVFSVLLSALVLAVMFLVLRKHGVPWPALFVFLTLCAGGLFIARLTMIRSHVLSILLQVIGLHLLMSPRRHRHIFVLGAVYAWSYTVPFALVMTALPLVLGRWLFRGGLDWRAVLAAGLGAVAGLAAHPYTPLTLETFFTYVQVLTSGLAGVETAGVELGNEIYPYPPRVFWGIYPLLSVAGLTLLPLCLILRRRLRPETGGAALASTFWFGMTLASARFAEYSVPLLAMAWGLTIRDLTAHGAPALWLNNRRWLRALLVVGLLAGTVALHLRCLRFYSLYRNLNPAFQFRDATRWMARNLQPGAVVVNLDWDDFPELYYDGHRQRYIWGLDPTYSLRQDRALSLQLEAYARGRAPVDPGLLRRRLGADFMIMRRNRGGGRPGLARGRIPVVYSDRWAMVFDLRPQGLRRPED